MPVTKKTYSLNKMKQLIDLNGDVTNFDLTFTATSKDGSPFSVLVVDQTTLDSSSSLNYKKAEGTISGNIISDKGVYQNYFLLLKADSPCECDVTIDIKIIPKVSPPPPPPPVKTHLSNSRNLTPPQKPSSINWKFLLMFILVVGGGASLWYMYNKRSVVKVISSPILASSPVASPSPIPAPKRPTGQAFSFGGKSVNESLLARLNNLPVKA